MRGVDIVEDEVDAAVTLLAALLSLFEVVFGEDLTVVSAEAEVVVVARGIKLAAFDHVPDKVHRLVAAGVTLVSGPHHNIIQRVRHGLKPNGKAVRASKEALISFVSQIRNAEGPCGGFSLKSEAAVVVGDGTDGRSFQHHGDGRQRLTCDGVFYDTLDVYRVLRQRPCRPRATEGQEHEQSAENSSCHFGSMGRGSEKMGRESRAFHPGGVGICKHTDINRERKNRKCDRGLCFLA